MVSRCGLWMEIVVRSYGIEVFTFAAAPLQCVPESEAPHCITTVYALAPDACNTGTSTLAQDAGHVHSS